MSIAHSINPICKYYLSDRSKSTFAAVSLPLSDANWARLLTHPYSSIQWCHKMADLINHWIWNWLAKMEYSPQKTQWGNGKDISVLTHWEQTSTGLPRWNTKVCFSGVLSAFCRIAGVYWWYLPRGNCGYRHNAVSKKHAFFSTWLGDSIVSS